MTRKWGFIAFISLLLIFPLKIVAEEEEEGVQGILQVFAQEQTVESGAKIPIPEKQAPYSVSVITADDIKMYQPQQIEDLLERIPGVDVFRNNDSTSVLNIRGFNDGTSHSTRVLFLVNDVPVFITTQGLNLADTLPVPLEDIEKIEVIRTPTTVGGANAVEGMISITTKKPGETPGLRLRTSLGNNQTNQNYLNYNNSSNQFGYSVSLSDYNSNLWRSDFLNQPNNVPAAPSPYSQRFKLLSQFNYTSGDETWNFLFGRSSTQNIFESSAAVVPLPIERDLGTLTYAKTLGPLSKLTLRLAHDRTTGEVDTVYFGPMEPASFQESRDDFSIEHYFPWGGHQLFTHGALVYNYRTLSSNDPTPPFVLPSSKPGLSLLSTNLNQNGFGYYFQNKSDLSTESSLYLGGRYDADWTGYHHFAPFVSVVHQINPDLTLRGNVNVAYRDPSDADLFDNLTFGVTIPPFPLPIAILAYGSQFAGQTLLPEKVTSYELSFGGNFSKSFKGKLEIYHRNIDNYIVSVAGVITPANFSSPPFNGILLPTLLPPTCGAPLCPAAAILSYPRNIPHAETTGAEYSFDYFVNETLSFYGNTRYQTASEVLSPAEAAFSLMPIAQNILTSPRWISTVGMKYTQNSVEGFLEAHQWDIRNGNGLQISPNTVLNTGVRFPIEKNLDVGATANDLLGTMEKGRTTTIIPWRKYQLSLYYGF